jgi:threonine/homoserine/homoserine lactone efflux protein
MEMNVFIKGVVMGFSIAAPVGPIGLLCIRRSLMQGRLYGFVSGLGAAAADAMYGCIAAFGLTLIANFLLNHLALIRFFGGIFLCYLGWNIYASRPAEADAGLERNGLIGSFVSTMALTLTNPMTILSFGAIFAGLGIGGMAGNFFTAIYLVTGVFLGSALWWFVLSFAVSRLHARFDAQHMRWVNQGSGIMIVVFGVIALVSLLK